MNKCIFFCLLLSLCQCRPKENAEVKHLDESRFTVERADEWTNIFLRKLGWFGGDGLFAIPLSGNDRKAQDSVLFTFSDTMIGEIKGDELRPGYVMVNNSVAVIDGKDPLSEKITFQVAKEEGEYKAVFVPQNTAEGTYFWLGDGFVNHKKNKDLFLFAYRITNTYDQSDFPFKETGNTLIRIPNGSRFPYEDQSHLTLPFNDYENGSSTISFGAGVLDNSAEAGGDKPDGYLYIYGIKDTDKKLVVARVRPELVEDFQAWEFYSKSGDWTRETKQIAALADSVSNEMSVSQLSDGRYALVYQLGGIFPDIMLQVGDTPVGPFGPRIKLYDTRNDITDPDLFTYNAKAHPALSKEGELLISYNVNSFKFFDVIGNKPNLYRPRFIRVKFKNKDENE